MMPPFVGMTEKDTVRRFVIPTNERNHGMSPFDGMTAEVRPWS